MTKIKGLVISLILAGLCIGYYFYLDSKSNVKEEPDTVTEVDKLINRNIKKTYPETPREVVKLYNRIMLCFYNEKYSEEQLARLSAQARLLFDEELLEKNPYEEYYARLCEEIQSYRDDDRTITSCKLAESDDVDFYTIKKQKYASVQCLYYSKGDAGTIKTSEEYVLRKDENNKWKILYWKLADKNDEK